MRALVLFFIFTVWLSLHAKMLAQDNQEEDGPNAVERQNLLQGEVRLYGPVVEAAYKPIVRYAPERYRKKLAETNLEFFPRDTAFDFFGGSSDAEKGTIGMSGGALRSLDICCWAAVLATDVLHEDQWFSNYIAYVRNALRRGDTFVADPMRASGVRFEELSKASISKESWTFTSALAFILAHEAGHVALDQSFEQEANESQSDFYARLRKQEEDADRFALETLARMKALPTGASFISGCTILIYQRSPRIAVIATHPPDHLRLRKMMRYALDNLDSYYIGNFSKEEIAAQLEQGILLAQQIDNGTFSFRDLDEIASRTTLKSLKRR